MKTVHRQEMLNGKSLRLLGFIGTHVSVAQSYPHDSLLHVMYQVLAANGMSRAELWKGGLHAWMVGVFCSSTWCDLTLD